jgi:hypothetical protein
MKLPDRFRFWESEDEQRIRKYNAVNQGLYCYKKVEQLLEGQYKEIYQFGKECLIRGHTPSAQSSAEHLAELEVMIEENAYMIHVLNFAWHAIRNAPYTNGCYYPELPGTLPFKGTVKSIGSLLEELSHKKDPNALEARKTRILCRMEAEIKDEYKRIRTKEGRLR